MTTVFLRFVSIKYRDKEVSLQDVPPVTPEQQPFIIGRQQIAEWLGCSDKLLGAVSEKQILIKYRESGGPYGGFYICNLGLNDLMLDATKVSDGPDQRGQLIMGDSQVTVRASNDDYERIQITLKTNVNRATQPTESDDWTRLISCLKSDRRVVHIYGLPGSGKSHLVDGLTSLNAPWPEKRRREGLADFWVLRIDGYELLTDEAQPWFEMCYAILSALRAKSMGDRAAAVNQAIAQLSNQFQPNPRDAAAILNKPFASMREADIRILLILENFDEVYKRIDWRMISWLKTVQANYSNVSLVLVTRRSLFFLNQYRSDSSAAVQRVIDSFRHLFTQNDGYLSMRCWTFDLFRQRIAYLLVGESLSAEDQKKLWELTGGHPQLSVEVCNYLRQHNLLASPQEWLESLAALPPESTIFRCFEKIWYFLSPGERVVIQRYVTQKRLTSEDKHALIQLDILKSGGESALFTPLFAYYMPRFDTAYTGLQERNGQLFLDDQEISLGHKAEPIIRYLLDRSDRFQAEEELIEQFYPGQEFDYAVKALKRLISRQNKTWQGEFIIYDRNYGYKLVPNPKRG